MIYGGFSRRRKMCPFKRRNVKEIDFKDLNTLRNFITEDRQNCASRITGVSAKYQRMLSLAIKRARFLALLPYTDRH